MGGAMINDCWDYEAYNVECISDIPYKPVSSYINSQDSRFKVVIPPLNSLLEYFLQDVLVCIFKTIQNKAGDANITLTHCSPTCKNPTC